MRYARTSRTTPLLREQQSPSSSASPEGSPSGREENNPFAPPPEGRPDQPWQPRHRPDTAPGGEGVGGGSGDDGRAAPGGPGEPGSPGSPTGTPWPAAPGTPGGAIQSDQGGQSGQGDQEGQGGGQGGQDGPPQQPPAWGSQWSSRQPGRQNGGFGSNPGRPNGTGGQGGSGGPRWDPNDPAQRRARYALLAGMWAFFFALFSLPEIALLLGALAVYWGISSLRAKPRRPAPTPPSAAPLNAPPPAPGTTPAHLPAPGSSPSKPQATAAISGLVTGGLALAIVAATFTTQIVYSDYYSCVDDSLTQTSRHACEDLLPKQLRPLLSTED
ncbi:hypothetical protein ACFV2X_37155 [Streptomyces sp. NPDC059679]|uniref:hypothetical protein n=1 Tax=Streptomyces sp. NPDC059679 TaxID=3346903 RepID=UPI003693D4DE